MTNERTALQEAIDQCSDDATMDDVRYLAEIVGTPVITQSLFDSVIDCLYEYDLGQELSESWPTEVKDAIEAARQRILKQEATPRIATFYPAERGWTKEAIAEVVNHYLPLIDETDRPVTVDEINDIDAQLFVDGFGDDHLAGLLIDKNRKHIQAWVNDLNSRKG